MAEPTPLQTLLDTLPQCGRVEWIPEIFRRNIVVSGLNLLALNATYLTERAEQTIRKKRDT
ncbi:hypothetical protein [Marinobacter sp. ATCH36]|uniref:hypothetical protein n=1 Tax=Marinobacter sp. ATCH36 TaxID=2945106 RepID=UPI0020219AA2|nr:hypothetical protein [Marinobacter sp. ATCH36]MCL7943630.1 hypothetical protein [Marinobacter sp. ATCH36]